VCSARVALPNRPAIAFANFRGIEECIPSTPRIDRGASAPCRLTTCDLWGTASESTGAATRCRSL
jgi:hypothetical protein